MQAVFPGRPQAKLQAVGTALWANTRIVTYISGNALVILRGSNDLVQTTTHGEDDEFEAVAIDEASGKIAVCTNSKVHVYQPLGLDIDFLQWSLQHTLIPQSGDSNISCLSWGLPRELLVGGAELSLFSTHQDPKELWTTKLANTITIATFSHDGSLIATTSRHDRLVKIWRRFFYGGDSERFDFTYLPHPAAVTSIRWRGHPGNEEHSDYVLYTLCVDNVLRVWTATDPHGLQTLQQWVELDLNSSIQPRVPPSPSPFKDRYVFTIDSWIFKAAVEHASAIDTGGEREKHTRAHLVEAAAQNPEICVVLDREGNMSAWGLERVGCKARMERDVFNMAHTDRFDMRFLSDSTPSEDYLQLITFGEHDSPFLHILANHFDGRLEWLSCPIDQLFDPSPQKSPLTVAASWTGHSKSIDKLVTERDMSTFLTLTTEDEAIVWRVMYVKGESAIERQSMIRLKQMATQALLLNGGKYALFLHQNSISLWDTQGLQGHQIQVIDHKLVGDLVYFSKVEKLPSATSFEYVTAISSSLAGIVWKVGCHDGASLIDIIESSKFKVKMDHPVRAIVPLSRDIINTSYEDESIFASFMSCDSLGTSQFLTGRLDEDISSASFSTNRTVSTMQTQPGIIAISTGNKKIAIADTSKSAFSIWHGNLELLEYTKTYEKHDEIKGLCWASAPQSQLVLAVSFAHKIFLYVQLRYDVFDDMPIWTSARELDLSFFTRMPVADVLWLANGQLVVAAGSQMFVYDQQIETTPDSSFVISHINLDQRQHRLFSICDLEDRTLPLYHPQTLASFVSAGRLEWVNQIATYLYDELKYFSEGDTLDNFLGLDFDDLSESLHFHKLDSPLVNGFQDSETQRFSEDKASALIERLAKVKLPYLFGEEQNQLVGKLQSLGSISRLVQSVDACGLRYLYALHTNDSTPSIAQLPKRFLTWREFSWASRSISQDILMDLTSRHFNGKMLWKDARETGIFMWLSDPEALRSQFESIARNEYTKTDEKNPVDCTLYYLALKKKSVLQGLWRMATWNREQAATTRLLANNFQDERWKTAALKNAYALLGRRRHEYAASFFLLADQLKDAVNVLANQVNDIQLAIAVARIYEGDDGPVLKSLLEEQVLPKAAQEGNRWLAFWAFGILGRNNTALLALTAPLETLIKLSSPLGPEARSYRADDPSYINLYQNLRDEPDPRNRNALDLSPKTEWDLIMRSVRLYRRMGCDLLALDLVRNWKFTITKPKPQEPTTTEAKITKTAEQTTMSIFDMEDEANLEEKKKQQLMVDGQPRKKVVEEPSASSILDSFDF